MRGLMRYILRMTPKELQRALDELGISRGGFGLMLGATRRSGENWTDPETGKVPGPVATMAELLLQRPELVALVQQINSAGAKRRKK